MNKKFKLTMFASMIAVALSGCSSDDSEGEGQVVSGNSVPVLTLTTGNSISINEKTNAVIRYNIKDIDVDDTHVVTYEVLDNVDVEGSFILDEENKTLTYRSVSVQEDENFKVLFSVKDSAGNTATEATIASRTTTITVVNSDNEKPIIDVSGFSVNEDGEVDIEVSPSNLEGIHSMIIPFNAIDNDNDELTITLGQLQTLSGSVSLNKDKNQIKIKIPEVYSADQKGSFDLTVSDGREENKIVFNLNLKKTEVSPELKAIVNPDRTDGIYEIPEGQTEFTFNFTKSDKNGDTVYVTAELSEDVATYENIIPNGSSSITLTDIEVAEDTLVRLTFNATDNTGTENVSDYVDIKIFACSDCGYIKAEEDKNTYIAQYDSLKSRKDELALYDFYSEYLVIVEAMTEIESSAQRSLIESNYLQNKTTIENQIILINAEIEKAENDESLKSNTSFVESLYSKVDDLKYMVKSYGEQNVKVLNALTELDSKLPKLKENQEIKEVKGSSYSKYVNNGAYGYPSVGKWVFSTEYEVLEVINTLSAQCQ